MPDTDLSPLSPDWSMRSLAEIDPFPAYDELRKRGDVVWDPGMNAWLVVSYEVCKQIEFDEDTYRIVPADLPDWMIDIRGGKAGLSTSTGEAHSRMRRVYTKIFAPRLMSLYRDKFVHPVIDYNIGRFAADGEAELFSQLMEIVPIRVILNACGLPWQDDDFVARLLEVNNGITAWVGMGHPNDEVIVNRAKLAADELRDMLRPFVVARKETPGDDLISRVWSLAAEEFGEISTYDMLAVALDLIAAAGHTTMHAMTNSTYLFLSDPEIRTAVVADQDKSLNALIEEALRMLGSPQWRFRRANQDIEVGGAKVAKNDLICMLHAAANRDPNRFACPHAVDLQRYRVADHLAFNVGPRICVGMPLARLEIREVIKTLINRFPNIQLDRSKEPPRFRGFTHRSFAPLHVKLG